MKIHSIHQNISGKWRNNRQTYRLLAFCGAVALCIMTCNTADAQSRAFARSSALQTEASNMVRNGLFISDDESYQVVNTAGFRTAADIGTTELGSIAQVGFNGSCDSTGTLCDGNCGGSCDSYSNYRNPCAPCIPFCYVMVEGLYMQREGDRRTTASPDFRLNGFDFAWAPRITIGSVPDCVSGCEVSFTGPLQWDMSAVAAPGGFVLGTLLTPGLPVAAADLSAFSNADLQSQTYTADFWSLEVNKTLVGWDVAKLLAGFRYISYEEEYAYYSQNATEAGLLFSDVNNQMFGLQLGMDLLYPISNHVYTDFRARLGGFIDFAESNVFLDNAGDRVLATGDDGTEITVVFELGGGLRYQLGEMLSVRAGAEIWYMDGAANAPDQFANNIIRPTTGRDIRVEDDVLFAGFSFGAELKF
jgi:hypothetical protein